MKYKKYQESLFKVIKLPQTSSLAFISGIFFTVFVVVGIGFLATSSLAGSLTPPGAPANTFYTLTDIYNLSTGTTTTEGSGGLPATPGTATSTFRTLTEVYSALATQISNISSTTLRTGNTAFGVTGTLYPGGLLQTNQATCYTTAGATTTCSGTGQDGELQKGLALSYTDNGDGTILDNQTGLTWQKGTTTTYTHANALAYCNNNTPSLPGTGWRLPNVKELFSLVDFGVKSTVMINTTYFPSTPQVSFWSATTYPYTGFQGNALVVDFSDGDVFYSGKAVSYYVRCVRE